MRTVFVVSYWNADEELAEVSGAWTLAKDAEAHILDVTDTTIDDWTVEFDSMRNRWVYDNKDLGGDRYLVTTVEISGAN